MSDALAGLLRSRKFWILVIDTIISLVLYFVDAYAPDTLPDVNVVILALQPIAIALVGAVAYEDGKKLEAGVHPSSKPESLNME